MGRRQKKKKVEAVRKKRSWRYWTTVWVIAVLVGYPLSFGPASWWLSRQNVFSESPARDLVGFVYIPCGLTTLHVPVAGDALRWYATLGAGKRGYCLPVGWRRWIVNKSDRPAGVPAGPPVRMSLDEKPLVPPPSDGKIEE